MSGHDILRQNKAFFKLKEIKTFHFYGSLYLITTTVTVIPGYILRWLLYHENLTPVQPNRECRAHSTS